MSVLCSAFISFLFLQSSNQLQQIYSDLDGKCFNHPNTGELICLTTPTPTLTQINLTRIQSFEATDAFIPSSTASATPTSPPSQDQNVPAKILLTIKLPGIGSNSSLGENSVPKHRERDFKIIFFDKDDKLVKEIEGRLNFDGSQYSETVQIPNIEPGDYTIKVKSNNSLLKSIIGIIKLESGVSAQIPQFTLVSGNVNDSGESTNNLNILDYNSILSYFGKSVNDVNGELADLSDDGVVNEKDINILLRGFIIRKGD